MILGVVDQTVIGEDDALGAATALAVGVDVALVVLPPVGLGQDALPVAEFVAADGRALLVLLDAAALPAQLPCLGLGPCTG